MILHVLHGGAFGGVENTFYRLINNNNFDLNKNKILFLNTKPVLFNDLDKNYFISKKELYKSTFKKVYFHSDFRGIYIALFFKFFKKSIIVQVCHGRLIYASNNILIIKYLLLLKYFINKYLTDEAYSVSEIAGKEYFSKKFNVIDYSIFKKFNLNSEFILNTNLTINILHIGRYHNSILLKDAKNQKFILEILKRLNKFQIQYHITFIGCGYNKKFIKQLNEITKCNYVIKKNIVDLTTEFNNANIFIFPSIHESFGQALFFAQLLNLYCICSNIIPKEAIISNNTKVLSIEKDSINDWVQSIIDSKIISNNFNNNFTYDYFASLFAVNFINQI